MARANLCLGVVVQLQDLLQELNEARAMIQAREGAVQEREGTVNALAVIVEGREKAVEVSESVGQRSGRVLLAAPLHLLYPF